MPANEGLEAELDDAERATAEARTLVADARALVTSLERDAADAQQSAHRAGDGTRALADAQPGRRPADRHAQRAQGGGRQRSSPISPICRRRSKSSAARSSTELAEAERLRQTAADALAAADTAHREAQKALRTIQATHAAERESRARNEARLEAARQKRSEEARKIARDHRVRAAGLPRAGRAGARRRAAGAGRGRPQAAAAQGRPRAARQRQSHGRRGPDQDHRAVRRHGYGAARRRAGDQQAARRHRPAQPRGAGRACARPSSTVNAHFAAAVQHAVRRRRGAAGNDGERGGPARGRPRDRRQAAGQEAGNASRCCRAASRR